MKQIYIDKENWVTYEYWPVNEAVMDFKVYEIGAMSIENSEIDYRKKNGPSFEPTKNLEDAEVLLSGDIKFDGCINVVFADQENCMPHFCGNPADKFKAIFDQLYRFAAEMMPDHADYLLNK